MTTTEPSNRESLHSIKSNDQRLKSLEEYEREKRDRKRLIKDAVEKSTHMKFDSDGEDDQPKKFVEKKIQLFDDSEVLNVEEHFSEKKVSKKKQKLQDLQAQLTTTNDPRFQFSEEFLDEEISFEEEKKKSLAILDQIINAKASISKPKAKMIRFDPSKSEHRIYELQGATQSNGDHYNSVEELQAKEEQTVVDSKRVYQFDESKLKSMFDKTTESKNTSNDNGQFQFQFFNQTESINLSSSKVSAVPKPMINIKAKVFPNKPDDTSSDEDEHAEASLPEEMEIKNSTFFFFDIDARLNEGLESFVRTEDLNELDRTWPSKRKEIGEALRTKHRKAILRKDKHRVFNHRHRQKRFTNHAID